MSRPQSPVAGSAGITTPDVGSQALSGAHSRRSGAAGRSRGRVVHVEEAWQPCGACVAGYLGDDSRRPCPDCDATGVVPG